MPQKSRHSLVMTPTPCTVTGWIISIRPTYSCACALTYTVGSGCIKPATSLKQLKTEQKLLLTAYIKSYTRFRLPPKCMTLKDLWARFKVIDYLNVAKMTKYSTVNFSNDSTPCRVAGGIISIRRTNAVHIHAPIHLLLTYSHRITSVFGIWPVIEFPDLSANDLSSVPLPLVGSKIIIVLSHYCSFHYLFLPILVAAYVLTV